MNYSRFKKSDCDKRYDVIIIGSGPSGLATASLLTKKGKSVIVLEQHDRPGGGMHSIKGEEISNHGKGLEFDTGIHYLGELKPENELRKIVNHLTGSRVEFNSMGEIYDMLQFPKHNFPIQQFGIVKGVEPWKNNLINTFPDNKTEIEKYYNDMKFVESKSIFYLIWRSLRFGSFLKNLLYRPLVKPIISYLTKRTNESETFLNMHPVLKSYLDYLPLGCVGIGSNEISYANMLNIQSHYKDGAFYPVGGSQSIVNGFLEEIKDGGGKVFVKAKVDKILTDDNNVTGVNIRNKGVVYSDKVISTIGLHSTFKNIIDVPEISNKLKKLSLTDGHVFGFIGLEYEKDEILPNFPKYNSWILPNMYNLTKCDEKFKEDVYTEPFSYIALAFPYSKDPRKVITNGKTLVTCEIVAGNIPWSTFSEWETARVHSRGKIYARLKQKFENRMLETLYKQFPETNNHVSFIEVGTPLSTNYYLGKTRGESYAIKQDLNKIEADLTWLGPRIEGSPNGLYFAGQDIVSNGFGASIISAYMVVASIYGFWEWFKLIPLLGWRVLFR